MLKNHEDVLPGVRITVEEPDRNWPSHLVPAPTVYHVKTIPELANEDASNTKKGRKSKPSDKMSKISKQEDSPMGVPDIVYYLNSDGDLMVVEPHQHHGHSGNYSVNPDETELENSQSKVCQTELFDNGFNPDIFNETLEPLLKNISGDVVNPGFHSWMTKQVANIKQHVENIQESMESITDTRTAAIFENMLWSKSSAKLDRLIPLKTMTDADRLIEMVEDVDLKCLLISKLYSRDVCGNDLKECVRGIMLRLLTNRVASDFDWHRSRCGRRSFAGSSLKQIICDVVRRNRNLAHVSEVAINDAIKIWLKNTKKIVASKEAHGVV